MDELPPQADNAMAAASATDAARILSTVREMRLPSARVVMSECTVVLPSGVPAAGGAKITPKQT
ncbi:hypothetical protein JMUB6875_47200 [Nocardia sp. JMUB6875]